MRAVLRSVAAVVAGFIAASIVMMIVETINTACCIPSWRKPRKG
jgi:hypothetical protein